jgi:predicted transcriptional regulator of viral defense system
LLSKLEKQGAIARFDRGQIIVKHLIQ